MAVLLFSLGTQTSVPQPLPFTCGTRRAHDLPCKSGSQHTVPANSTCEWPLIDPGGRFVAFLSTAANLVTNSIAGDRHCFVRDMLMGTTTLVDVYTNGSGSSIGPTTIPKMSDDGRFFAFESLDASLTTNDRNHDYDVFVRDLTTNTVELISARHPALHRPLRPAQSAGSHSPSAPMAGSSRFPAKLIISFSTIPTGCATFFYAMPGPEPICS